MDGRIDANIQAHHWFSSLRKGFRDLWRAPADGTQRARKQSMPTPKRILIVDDEDAILFAMCDYFTLHGYEVDAARDVTQAAACLDACRYAVVIADVCLSELPSADGLEVARYVRKRRPETAVVLFTAYGSSEVEAEARRHGVRVVLRKPQPLAEIERLISRLVANGREGRVS